MRRIAELDGLRALLALWVILVHAGKSVFPENDLPLSDILFDEKTRIKIFFMISGMVIFGMLYGKPVSYRQYMVGRLRRIYPVYLASLVISLAMLPVSRYALLSFPFPTNFDAHRVELIDTAQVSLVTHIIAHLTLLHGVIPSNLLPYAPYTIIGQAWNISTEFQFYLLAPLIIWVMTKNAAGLCLGAAALLALAMVGHWYPNGAFLGKSLHFFLIGIVSYLVTMKIFPRMKDKLKKQLGLCAIIAVIAIAVGFFDRSISLWMIFLLLVTPSYAWGWRINILAILKSPLMVYLGSLSYSIYLSHMAILYPVALLLTPLGLSRMSLFILLYVVTAVGSAGLAWLLHKFVERPFVQRGIKGRLPIHPHSQAATSAAP